VQVEAADYISKCQAGYSRCKGEIVQVCTDDGEGWRTDVVCGPTEICRDAACVPAEVPSGGADVTDAGTTPDTTVPLDLSIAPLPDTTGGKLGNRIDVVLRLTIVDAVEGAYVDLGFCSGTQAHAITNAEPVCDGSFFLRVRRGATGLAGQLYMHEQGQQVIEPQLWSVEEAGPVDFPMLADELYELSIQDYEDLVEGDGRQQLSFTLRGVSSGAFTSAAVDVPESTLAALGLWNLETEGDGEQGLQGMIAGLELVVDGEDHIALEDFVALAAEQGDVIQSPPTVPWLDFYVSSAQAGSAMVKIP
jgi:hypothetical protein